MVLTVHVLRRQQTFTFITFNWLPLVNTYDNAERGNDSVRSSVCSCVRRITENFYVFLGGPWTARYYCDKDDTSNLSLSFFDFDALFVVGSY